MDLNDKELESSHGSHGSQRSSNDPSSNWTPSDLSDLRAPEAAKQIGPGHEAVEAMAHGPPWPTMGPGGWMKAVTHPENPTTPAA